MVRTLTVSLEDAGRIANKMARRPKEEQLSGGHRDQPRAGGTDTLERMPAPNTADADWDREWQQHLLDAACERLARRVNPRHYQVFDLYVRRRMPVLRVARELALDPASIYVIGSRLTKQLKAEVAKLRERLG